MFLYNVYISVIFMSFKQFLKYLIKNIYNKLDIFMPHELGYFCVYLCCLIHNIMFLIFPQK